MRYHTIRVLHLGLVVTCLATVSLHAQNLADVAARRAIDSANARSIRAYNAGDVATFLQVYAPDATVLPANEPTIHGQHAIAEWWHDGWKQGIRNVRLTTGELHVQGNLAAEVGRYELDVQPPTGNASHDSGKYIVLWKRNAKGTWQVYRDMSNSDLPAAP